MFKLLAIRALYGCRPSVLKCLRVGEFYYFCNDYIITDKTVSLRDKYVRPLSNDFFCSKGQGMPLINIEAIVGMNGDGKSSLKELMMRLINNCAKYYGLMDVNNLLRIEGVKAELYYMIDDIVYCMRESKEDKDTQLFKFAEILEVNQRDWPGKLMPITDVSRCRDLFYTIISNYSIYAYNTQDFRSELDNTLEDVAEETQRSWLYYLFHKNDGYRTPLTLHPFRNEGNIEINKETSLALQRLTALYIQEPGRRENPDSFRKIGGKYASWLRISDIGYSKLQEYSIA